jgi:hypothetical protein
MHLLTMVLKDNILLTTVLRNLRHREVAQMDLKKSHIIVFFFLIAVSLFVFNGCKGKAASENLIKNGDFETWSQGGNKNPDGWILGGAAAGTVNKDTSIVKTGKNSAKVTMSSGEALALYQDVKNFARYNGKNFVFSCWVKADSPNSALINVHDGIAWVNSGVHSGSGQWEQLIAKGKISGNASKLRVHLWVKNNAVVQFDGASLIIQ